MRVIGRIIGFLLLVLGVIVLLRDIIAWFDTDKIVSMTGSQLWFTLSPDGFEATDAALRDRIPTLWNLISTTLLGWPAFIVSLVLGAILMYVFRNRSKEKNRPRRRRR
jgi:hypothetical protein